MARSKVVKKVKQLTDVQVDAISIVKRGANQIPFRILKHDDQEKEMINLSGLFSLKKKDVAPAIAQFVLRKGDSTEGMEKALAEAGHTVVSKVEQDGMVVLNVHEGEVVEGTVIKMSEDLAVVVEGIQKGMMAIPDSNSFKENVAKGGFFPGLSVATDVLRETIFNIATSEGDQDATITSLKKALTDYSDYVVSLAEQIPQGVFKIDRIEPVAVEKAEEPAAEEPAAEEPAAEEPAAEEPAAEEPAAPEGEPEKVEKSGVAEFALKLDAVLKKLDAVDKVTSDVKALGSKVDALAATSEAVKKSAESAEKLAKEAKEQIKGTALSGSEQPDDLPSDSRIVKRDGDTGIFDSALHFDGFEVAP